MPNRKNDLEPSYEFIKGLIDEGHTLEGIIEALQDRGVTVSLSTLKRSLQKWDITQRSYIKDDIESWRESIASWCTEGLSRPDIRSRLASQGLNITKWNLDKVIHDWELSTRAALPFRQDDDNLRRRIVYYFRTTGITDEEMLYALQSEGFNVSKHSLQKIRLEIGCAKRYTAEQYESRREWITSVLKTELDNGRAEPLGIGTLYLLMRDKYGIIGR